MFGNLACADSVPDGQNQFGSRRLAGKQSSKFCFRPSFGKERGAENNDTEAGAGEAVVDAFPYRIPEFQNKAVVPNPQAGVFQSTGKATCEALVLTGMTNKDVIRCVARHLFNATTRVLIVKPVQPPPKIPSAALRVLSTGRVIAREQSALRAARAEARR